MIVVLICLAITGCSSGTATVAAVDDSGDDAGTPFNTELKAQPGIGRAQVSWTETDSTRLFWVETDPVVLSGTLLTDLDLQIIDMGTLVEALQSEGYDIQIGFVDDAGVAAAEEPFVHSYTHENLKNGKLYCYRIGDSNIECTIPMGDISSPGLQVISKSTAATFQFPWSDDSGMTSARLECRGVPPGESFSSETVLWENSFPLDKPPVVSIVNDKPVYAPLTQNITGLSNCEDIACRVVMINALNEEVIGPEGIASPDLEGKLDIDFGNGGVIERNDMYSNKFIDMDFVSDGGLVVLATDGSLIKYDADGKKVEWEYDTVFMDNVAGIAVGEKDEIMVVGDKTLGGIVYMSVCRYLDDGSGIDSGFGQPANPGCYYSAAKNTRGYDITFDSSGGMVVVGTDQSSAPNKLAVWRLDGDANLDMNFGTNGIYYYSGAADLLPHGVIVVDHAGEEKIVVVGKIGIPEELFIASIGADGSSAMVEMDNGFGGDTSGEDVTLAPNGTLVVMGHTKNITTTLYLWNYDLDLTKLYSFGYFGSSDTFGNSVITDCRQKMVAAGRAGMTGYSSAFLRLDPSDMFLLMYDSFGADGWYVYPDFSLIDIDEVLAVKQSNEGLIYGVGYAYISGDSANEPVIWRVK